MNIPQQRIYANSKGGLIIKRGIMSSEYGIHNYAKPYTKSYHFGVSNTTTTNMQMNQYVGILIAQKQSFGMCKITAAELFC